MHRLALGNRAIAEMSFDIDQMLARPDSEGAAGGAHVFVSGLARAGTTVLMRRFHASGAFRSLTYRDMPFVLAPNAWRRLAGRFGRDIARAERAHGDGILVDADSPESFDEVYWRIFCARSYLDETGLRAHAPDDADMAGYVRFVGAVLKSAPDGAGRYLSKNNNNIVRLGALCRAFPNALFVVPFRAPQAQAGSLLRQHRQFQTAQRDDPFQLRYMSWLAHHEFGLGHRPFLLGRAVAGGFDDPDRPDYWLALWLRVYRWLFETCPERVRFVCYETLCADPGLWERLRTDAGLAPNTRPHEPLRAAAGGAENFDPALLREAREVYGAMAAAGRDRPCRSAAPPQRRQTGGHGR